MIEQAEKYGSGKIALREKDLGIWQSLTWAEYLEKVKYFSLGMISLGFEPGDKISIIGDNKPEWIIAELAAQSAGGFGAGIYQDSILKEVAYIINHSETKFVIAEDQEQVDKILNMQQELPGVKKIIYYDPKGMSNIPIGSARPFPRRHRDGVANMKRAIPESLKKMLRIQNLLMSRGSAPHPGPRDSRSWRC